MYCGSCWKILKRGMIRFNLGFFMIILIVVEIRLEEVGGVEGKWGDLFRCCCY